MAGRKRALSIVLLLMTIFSFSFTPSIGAESRSLAIDKVGIDGKLRECKLDSRCILSILKNEEKKEGAGQVLELYKSKVESFGNLKSTCHTVTHKLGEDFFNRYGDKFFTDSNLFCYEGFMHGQLIALSKKYSGAKFFSQSYKLCNNLREENRGICFHGVGHGLAITSKSLLEGNNICLKFKLISMREECISGSSMEWINSRTLGKKYNKNELIKLCDTLSKTLLRECLAQTLQYQSSEGLDITSQKKYCYSLKSFERDGCLEALGYLITNRHFSDIERKNTVIRSLISNYCSEKDDYWCVSSILQRSNSLLNTSLTFEDTCLNLRNEALKFCEEIYNYKIKK